MIGNWEKGKEDYHLSSVVNCGQEDLLKKKRSIASSQESGRQPQRFRGAIFSKSSSVVVGLIVRALLPTVIRNNSKTTAGKQQERGSNKQINSYCLLHCIMKLARGSYF